MPRSGSVVRLSSKGQIVIPAALRRRLGLSTGQPLQVRAGASGAVVFEPVPTADAGEARLLERIREWTRKTGRDLVAELHARRRRERAEEARRRGRGRS